MVRKVFRSCAALALLWMAWGRTVGAESCQNASYCEWHVFANDYCVWAPGSSTHCEMTDSHECFTGDGNCLKVN